MRTIFDTVFFFIMMANLIAVWALIVGEIFRIVKSAILERRIERAKSLMKDYIAGLEEGRIREKIEREIPRIKHGIIAYFRGKERVGGRSVPIASEGKLIYFALESEGETLSSLNENPTASLIVAWQDSNSQSTLSLDGEVTFPAPEEVNPGISEELKGRVPGSDLILKILPERTTYCERPRCATEPTAKVRILSESTPIEGISLKKYISNLGILESLIKDEDMGDEFRTAIRSMGSLPSLVRGVKSKFVGTRAKVAEAMGSIGDPEYMEYLILLSNDPSPLVRAVASSAMRKVGDIRTVMPLTLLLNDPDQWVVTETVMSLGRMRREAVGILAPRLKHPNPRVRMWVAHILGDTGSADAVEPLVSALNEDDVKVKLSVISALGKLGTAMPAQVGKSVKALIDHISDDRWQVQIGIVEALGKLRAPEAITPLIRLFASSNPLVRARSIEAVERMPRDEVVVKSIEALREADLQRVSPDEPSRKRAKDTILGILEVFTRVKDPRLPVVLTGLLNEADPEIKSRCILALGEQGDTIATRPLVRLLSDSPFWFIRMRAAQALGKIGDARALRALKDASGDSNRWVSVRAMEAIKSIVSGMASQD
ncbi:MAG: HEAT repeat domain-containing protein [bacterium]